MVYLSVEDVVLDGMLSWKVLWLKVRTYIHRDPSQTKVLRLAEIYDLNAGETIYFGNLDDDDTPEINLTTFTIAQPRPHWVITWAT